MSSRVAKHPAEMAPIALRLSAEVLVAAHIIVNPMTPDALRHFCSKGSDRAMAIAMPTSIPVRLSDTEATLWHATHETSQITAADAGQVFE